MSIRQKARRSFVGPVGSSGYSVDQNSSGQTFFRKMSEVFLSVVRAGAGLKQGVNGEECQ